MQDLIKKIEELKGLVKSLLAKPGQNSLVPALKPPSVRPISMGAGKSTASTKIPGVTPPSGKDPAKVAQQLKNPRPKKVNVEVLKFDNGGQWKIEKSDDAENSDVIGLLDKAIALHKKHIDMPDTATAQSQSDMMHLMKEALKLLKK